MSRVFPVFFYSFSADAELGSLLLPTMRAIGWGLWGCLLAGVGWLAYRRLAGGMVEPLGAPWLAGVVLGAWTVAFLANRVLRETAVLRAFPRRPPSADAFSAARSVPMAGNLEVKTGGLAPGAGGSDLLEAVSLGAGGSLPGKDLSAGGAGSAPGQQVLVSAGGQGTAGRWITWAPRIDLGVLALCLSVPGTSLVGLVGLWGTVAIGLLLEGLLGRQDKIGHLSEAKPSRSRPNPFALPDQASGAESGLFITSPPDPQHWPDGLLEHLQRFRSAEGGELWLGWIRVDFAPGQRTAVTHIAFCPPFPRKPLLQLRQQAGPAVRLKSTHLYPYGLRLEVKRDPTELDKATWVVVAIKAQCPLESESDRAEAVSSP